MRRALQLARRKGEMLDLLADMALAMDDTLPESTVLEEVATAIEGLDQTSARHPRQMSAAWQFRVGQSRLRRGKLDEAVRAFETAVELSPENPDAWCGLARARHALEDIDGAIAAWEQAVALAPSDWAAHNDLGGAAMERNDFARADAAFAQAAALAGHQPIVAVNRATLDVRRGRRVEAIATLEACVTSHPDYAPAWTGLGFALRDHGCFEQAISAFRRAAAVVPEDAAVACALGRTLLQAGDAHAALASAQALLTDRPGHAGALALEVQARRALGDDDGVARLLDPRFIWHGQLATPEGFDDVAVFNAALAVHAASHRTLLRSPASHATADGLHSGSLLAAPRGPVAALVEALRAAIAVYARALPDLPAHPFVANRPSVASFNIWCVVLRRGGHQIPHIHPEAWLSGVYYPQVPAAIRAPAQSDDPAGCLEFGADDLPGAPSVTTRLPTHVSPSLFRVRPAEGLLVLFPSYFYHRTIPFDAEGTRISVAFDLMPARA